MNFTEDMNGIIKRDKNIVHLFEDTKSKVTVTQCPRITAMIIAQENNMTLQFCEKCVHANIGAASATVKYSHVKDKKDAAVMAIHECLEKYKSLTNKSWGDAK